MHKLKTATFIVLAFLSVSFVQAQEAKKLLNEVSAKAKSYDNIKIDFKYNLNNTKENVSQDTRGDVTISGCLLYTSDAADE